MNNNFRFTNEICPVCKKPFKENDDIVVCPLCGTPHHRDCYKSNGECANNEKHSDGYRWEASNNVPPVNEQNSNTPPQFNNMPPNKPNNATSYASFGGQPQFNPFNLFPKEVENGVLTEEAAEFVGASNFKYLQKFFYIKGNKRTFNWAAFFFAPYWFFYRKLHKIGAIFLSITVAMTLIVSFAGPSKQLASDMNEFMEKYEQTLYSQSPVEEQAQQISGDMKAVFAKNPVGTAILGAQSLINLALHLLAGFMADKWYFKFTTSKIKKIKSETSDINQQKLRFFKEGGIGMAVTIGVVLCIEILSMVISMILT